MFTANMIQYQVNEETKVVTASVSGVKYDAIETMLKSFRKFNLILSDKDVMVEMLRDEDGEFNPDTTSIIESPMTTCSKYMLPDTLTATAKYDPNDPNEFSVERGKQIARRRLYNQYNIAYQSALDNLIINIKDSAVKMCEQLAITCDRITNFKYFEFYDVFKAHMTEDTVKM